MRITKISGTSVNLLWNLVSGVVGGGAVFVSSGIMVRSLGYSSFGIISAWLALQTVIQILDFGLGSSVAREKSNSGTRWGDMLSAVRLFYWCVSVVALIAGLVAIVLVRASRDIDAPALALMGCALAIQFNSLFYTWVLAGAERQVVSSKIQMLANILRYGAAATVSLLTSSLATFFLTQIIISCLLLYVYHRSCRPYIERSVFGRPLDLISRLKPLLSHSSGMWMTSIAATVLGVTDRTLVGALCETADLGKYSTALIAANLLSLAILPFYRVYYSEFCRNFYENEAALVSTFYRSSLHLSFLIAALMFLSYVIGPALLMLWIPNMEEHQIMGFRLLVLGLGISGLMWIPGALTQAIGKPNIHVLMIASTLMVGAFASKVAIDEWGYRAAGILWVVHGLVCFLAEPVLIRRCFTAISVKAWYFRVTAVPIVFFGLAIDLYIRW